MRLTQILFLGSVLCSLGVCKTPVRVLSYTDIANNNKPGTHFLITDPINLNKETVELPVNSILIFSGDGRIINGIIKGNDSEIRAERNLIFDNIEVEGEWANRVVYSEWVPMKKGNIDNSASLRNLMSLCKGDRFTHLYVQEGIFSVAAQKGTAPIKVPSNTYWHNAATIKLLPNSFEKFYIVYLNMVDNVTIDGGSFVGDALNHKGTTGEWGHGIKCGGATRVKLLNLTCSYCWGDGIDLIEGIQNGSVSRICNNIIIDNVKCLNNRRQGMSIEAASNVRVSNSEFAYTGTPLFSSPGAGVDIEPWDNSCDKVWNISLINCLLHDNKNYDFICEPNIQKKERYRTLKNNIVISGCKMGVALIKYVYGVKIINSSIDSDLAMTMAEDIMIKDSHVEKHSKTRYVKKLRFNRCTGRGLK